MFLRLVVVSRPGLHVHSLRHPGALGRGGRGAGHSAHQPYVGGEGAGQLAELVQRHMAVQLAAGYQFVDVEGLGQAAALGE